jgi:glycerophosphoryl diester phosphodiesterase
MKIWSHGGARLQQIENTVFAFSRAIELGADGLYVDVRQCKSGELLCFSDRTLWRMATKLVSVENNSYQRLLDQTGFKIPILSEVLESTESPICINVCQAGIIDSRIESNIAGLIKDFYNKVGDTITVACESGLTLAKLSAALGKRHECNFALHWKPLDLFKQLAFRTLFFSHSIVDSKNISPKLVESHHNKGLKVCVANVESIGDAERIAASGADIIITKTIEDFKS